MPSNPFKAEPSGTRLALNRIGLRVRNLERRFFNPGTTVGVSAETLSYNTTTTGITSDIVLEAGLKYLVVVQGTFSIWNEVLSDGTPESDAMFPGSTDGRVSTEVGFDAETVFAWPPDDVRTPGHVPFFQIDLGSGFSHLEPDDGAHGTASPDHLYKYTVTGEGSAVSFKITDTVYADNYGLLQIAIQALDGGTGGGGGGGGGGTGGGVGSLVPPTDASMNGDILAVASGIPTWEPPSSLALASDIDGGSAGTTYLVSQKLDGGNA